LFKKPVAAQELVGHENCVMDFQWFERRPSSQIEQKLPILVSKGLDGVRVWEVGDEESTVFYFI